MVYLFTKQKIKRKNRKKDSGIMEMRFFFAIFGDNLPAGSDGELEVANRNML